jgi:thiamine-phosphate pyrophosphorylase
MKIHEKIKGLHVLTDRELAYPRSLLEIVESVVSGGASVLQLRDKNASIEEIITLGRQLQNLTIGNIPLIVNDNIEAALALNAAGIHVGQNDIPAKEAREIIGEKMILGISVFSVIQAIKAQEDGADYIGAGPLFPTLSKLDAGPILGLTGLKEIKMSVDIPVIAIGGITLENAFEVAKIVDGIAVISAVLKADNPKKAVMDFVKIIKNAGGRK